MSDIVQRLRRKTVAGQPVFPTPLDIDAANEIERQRARVGRDVGDFDYPPGSAPCMCFFSTAEDRGPDPLGECDYHKALRARLAECERLRDIISPGDAAAYEEGMAALLARCETAEARLAEAHDLLALAAGVALLPSGVPALPLAIRERIAAWLRAQEPPR